MALDGHRGVVNVVAFSPDGRTLASAGEDGTIRIWNPRDGKQVNGSGFAPAAGTARQLAGVRGDNASPEDRLGVRNDVVMLAELIAAVETQPPLAVAVIGDWGAGKSSVMLQVERAIDDLAGEAAAKSWVNAFTENVRQVRFNAWHYSDEHLWTGLVSRLFGVLATPPRHDLGADAGQRPDSRSVLARQAELTAEIAQTKRATEHLDRELAAVDAVPPHPGLPAWLGPPGYDLRVLLTAARQGYHDLPAIASALAVWAVLAAGTYLAWRFAGAWYASVVTLLAAIGVPSAAVVIRRVRLTHDKLQAFVRGQRATLKDQLASYRQRLRSLREQLALVDAAERLSQFLDESGKGEAYLKYEGLLGQVRADLDRLSDRLNEARQQWEAGGRSGPAPLERIVLYIDDLDRCPPRRVVEVLEAVHLMLALDLFVVVVAVDARWLIRSLEYHHRELFSYGGGKGGTGIEEEKVATAIDYLDKIFQIPFALLPSAPEATAAYLRSLLPGPARDDTSPALSSAAARTATAGETDAGDAEAAAAWPPARGRSSPVQTAGDDASEGNPLYQPKGTAEMGAETADHSPADGAEPRPRSPARPAAEAMVELRPQRLSASAAEIEFMARLGELLPTPRAAKRLVNIYRLVRIGIPDGELAAFTAPDGPYQAAQVLLAILVGHPEFALEMFRVILGSSSERIEDSCYADLAAVAEAAGGRGGKPHSFGLIHGFLTKIREEAPAAVSMAQARQWCPQLARFSFYTSQLAGQPIPR